jgi:aminoglycoside phosphotransferase
MASDGNNLNDSAWWRELLPAAYRDAEFDRINSGMSGAVVFSLSVGGGKNAYLKAASAADDKMEIEREIVMLDWLRERVPVPNILWRSQSASFTAVVTSAVPGSPASSSDTESRDDDLALACGIAMRRLHSVPAAGCPIRHRTEDLISEAKRRVAEGLVRVDLLDDAYAGRPPEDLLTELIDTRPNIWDPVVAHGDFCLSNVILRDGTLSGFVDLGRAGIADRYRDIALFLRSFSFNTGLSGLELLKAGYGIDHLDEQRLRWYQLLDEFF